MATVWIISDTHFSHANILKFTREDGSLLRPGFPNAEVMDEYMINQWNSVVRPKDHVYHLGDFSMDEKLVAKFAPRLNGKKRLILGNHDGFKMSVYIPYFQKIYGTKLIDGLLLSHFPIHPLSLGKAIANVHGHVHANVGPDHFGKQYYNVSIEVLPEYKPISLEQLKEKVLARLA